MIKFFRRIRYQLMSENKTGKYFKYAIGEILLVVIGILIALQINNWNDLKKDSETEFTYYERILEDLKLDKMLIDTLFQDGTKRINDSKELLLELNSGTKGKHYILNKFLLAVRSNAYVPRKATFTDLLSSGNLNLLQDVTIKNSLIQYYSDHEAIISQLNQNRKQIVDESFKIINTLGFGVQEFNYVKSQLEPEILKILPDVDWVNDKSNMSYKEFQNLILFNIAMSDRVKQHLTTILNLMDEPYQLLEEKCKKKDD